MTTGPHLSCARRLVLVDVAGAAVADGVAFPGGSVVLCPRGTDHVEVYDAGALTRAPIAGHVEWIDAQRPSPCLPTERTTGG